MTLFNVSNLYRIRGSAARWAPTRTPRSSSTSQRRSWPSGLRSRTARPPTAASNTFPHRTRVRAEVESRLLLDAHILNSFSVYVLFLSLLICNPLSKFYCVEDGLHNGRRMIRNPDPTASEHVLYTADLRAYSDADFQQALIPAGAPVGQQFCFSS